MNELNKEFTKMERCFNMAVAVPVVNIFSSGLRAVVAKAQIVAGAAMGAIGLIGHALSNNPKYLNLVNFGGTHLLHGFANTARAVGELCLSLTLLGGPIFALWQYASPNKFNPIVFKYDAV